MAVEHLFLNTGEKIPLVGLGTYNTSDEMKTVVDAALGCGYRLFDTAKVYNNESHLGEAIEALLPKHSLSRSDVMIETKVLPYNDSARIRSDILDSLVKLRTDYIDIVLIHYPKNNDCENEDKTNKDCRRITYLTLEELKREGKIRSVGVSNFERKHLEELAKYAESLPAINQVELHPHFTRKDLQTFCRTNNILIQAFSSLAKHNETLMNDPCLLKIAAAHNANPLHILLSWAYSQQIAIIPKSATPSRIIDNMNQVCSIKLSDEEIKELYGLNLDKNYVGRCTGWLVA